MVKTKFSEFSGIKIDKVVAESSIKFEALAVMREVQTALAAISLLDVLGVMSPENPLRQNVIDMEAKIHEITVEIGEFINDNLADAEVEDEETPDDEKEPAPKKDAKDAKKDPAPKKDPKADTKKDDKKSGKADAGTEAPKDDAKAEPKADTSEEA